MKRRNSTPPASVSLTASSPCATPEGTARYCARHSGGFAPDHFRSASHGITVSSIGIGTYLGESTDAEDTRYAGALSLALASGVNVIDTAINYRCQRSEGVVGSVLQQTFSRSEVQRDEVVVCSKGGYIPLDGEPPPDRAAYDAYVDREFYRQGVMLPDDVVAGGHCITPTFLKYCIARSRQNLGVRTIDIYYLHNPEQQIGSAPPDEVKARFRAAFGALEEAVSHRDIGVYGVSTWNAFRVPSETRGHLSMEALVELARDVAGDSHHFRAVQLPVNLAMTEAVRAATQVVEGCAVTALDAARALGLSVFASAALMQGQLARSLPDAVRGLFPHAATDAERALSFVRTLPGVTTALVGTRSTTHLKDALASAYAH